MEQYPEGDDSGTEAPSVDLHSVVERNESGVDRRTVYPRGAPPKDRMTRWFTADDGAFVELESIR